MRQLMLSISFVLLNSLSFAEEVVHGASAHHAPPIYWVLPFILMLGSIAIFPLVKEHWWEHNKNKLMISALLGIPTLIYLFMQGHTAHIQHAIIEYFQFIILLGSLFYVSGGVVLRGDIEATPLTNTKFIALGGILASFVGTTGASMLLIRPLLNTNKERHHIVHTVIFFIFIVSNMGGLLTPLGDPPLFLGFLRGVPFTWTFGLWKEWLLGNAILLVVYFIWDTLAHKKETKGDISRDHFEIQPLSIVGKINFLFLLGIVISVAFIPTPYREVAMIFMIIGSSIATSKELRSENKFTLHPINEVAALFIGIFITMIPAIMLLQIHGPELGFDSMVKFFWGTGLLSSFLDNAPTYVTFFETARTIHLEGATLIAGVPEPFLIAISIGAVFMGANTYIGNGPNFMVKAIAEETGIKMPSFFGYMLYSGLILIPLFILITFIFLI